MGLKFTIDIGFFLDILPISVAQVSDIAAEIDARNKKKLIALGWIKSKIQMSRAIPPFA